MSKMGVYLYGPNQQVTNMMFGQGFLPENGLGTNNQGRRSPIVPSPLPLRIRTRIFSAGVAERPVPYADALTWKSDAPVWVDQWPLSAEKMQAAKLLALEQLEKGHFVPSNSPWNSPIFVIKEKILSVEIVAGFTKNQRNHGINGSFTARRTLPRSHTKKHI